MDLSDCFWQEVIFFMFLFLSLSLSLSFKIDQ